MLGMKLHDYLLKKISNHAIKSKVNITVSKKYREPIDIQLQDLFIICLKTKRTLISFRFIVHMIPPIGCSILILI